MNITLYYFSGTGNSLVVARKLAERLGQTELVSVSELLNQPQIVAPAGKIGIVFPVYCWGMPRIVKQFLQKLSLTDQYVFAVVTMGGFPGTTLLKVDELLRSKGHRLSAGFALKMPGNFIPLYGAPEPSTQKKLFAHVQGKLDRIESVIREGKTAVIERSNWLANVLTSWFYVFAMPNFAKNDKNFTLTEACTHCGVCEKVCPVKNIKMLNGKPTWQGNCEQCLACIQWCPVQAIQAGKKTVGRRRYHHPEVNVADFFQK